MKIRKLFFMPIILLVAIAMSGIAMAHDTEDVSKTIKSFSKGNITKQDVKAKLIEKYTAGTLTRADLKRVLTVSYNHNKLTRVDLRYLLFVMYSDGELKRSDIRWILMQAYIHNELTRDDIRFLITKAYKNGELERSDMKGLIIESYKQGELKRSDIRWILTYAYKKGELTREDIKWVLIQSYNQGELTREDLRIILTAAYNHGELTREDIKWVLAKGYNEDKLTKDDLKWLLENAYKKGELRKTDVLWLINKLEKEGIEVGLGVESVSVEEKPSEVPSIVEITEPNAPTATGAETATTFDETKTPAPIESVLKTKQTWMQYKYTLIPIEKRRIGMESLIGYAEDINASIEELNVLKDQFISLRDQLESAAELGDRKEGKDIISQIKETIRNFRKEIRIQIKVDEISSANATLRQALEKNEDYFNSLVTEARESRRDRNLEIFDLLNARAQGRLDKLAEKEFDISDTQAKLDEIKEKRSEFIEIRNNGIKVCDGTGLGECDKPEVEEYNALKSEIKDDYRELINIAKQAKQGQIIAKALDKADAIISKAENTLIGAESKGRDVTEEKTKLDEIKTIAQSARAKYNNEDYVGATEDLKLVKDKFKALKQEVLSKRGGKK